VCLHISASREARNAVTRGDDSSDPRKCLRTAEPRPGSRPSPTRPGNGRATRTPSRSRRRSTTPVDEDTSSRWLATRARSGPGGPTRAPVASSGDRDRSTAGHSTTTRSLSAAARPLRDRLPSACRRPVSFGDCRDLAGSQSAATEFPLLSQGSTAYKPPTRRYYLGCAIRLSLTLEIRNMPMTAITADAPKER